jgi:acyl-coenzyme A thioesterase PaaI-like protein
VTREGPFWDVMEGRAAPPPAAILLGWELIAVDPEAGTIEVAFTASEQFLNPAGVIQGGFLAAMLDDTLGPALVATLGPGLFAPTTDLHVQFPAPGAPRAAHRPWPDRPPRPGGRVPGRRAAR